MKWQDGRRDDPKPCREKDEGRFEISTRDGQARLGKLHTKHGILETPCLLPVINPNIRTIEPREMAIKIKQRVNDEDRAFVRKSCIRFAFPGDDEDGEHNDH